MVTGIKDVIHAKTVPIIKKIQNWTVPTAAIMQVTIFDQFSKPFSSKKLLYSSAIY